MLSLVSGRFDLPIRATNREGRPVADVLWARACHAAGFSRGYGCGLVTLGVVYGALRAMGVVS